ncbi:MAG: radical SAM protein [Candidatus Margulisbacteria bacterium]|nr:radical SAM protein [Candidatus Margulisiibacteriota bacterium]
MNILFIYSTDDSVSLLKPLNSSEYIAFGISYISAVLKANKYNTDILVLSSNYGKAYVKLLEEKINNNNPELICFTAVSSQYSFISQVADYIKNIRPDIFLVIGGAHASLAPDNVITDSFNALCIGEGEFPTLELAQKIRDKEEITAIPNLWIKKTEIVEKNNSRPFMHDLDILPFPDRESWQPWIDEKNEARIAVLLGRGCPYSCTYCSNHALRKLATGKYVRLRTVKNIIEEIKHLLGKYPDHRSYYLEVETLTINKEWLFELCEQLHNLNSTLNNPIGFSANYRVSKNALDDAIFQALKKANFVSLNIGLESGSERVRREILDRSYTNDEFLQAVSLARKYGLKVNLYNLVGLPGETYNDYLETVKINRIARPDSVMTSIFFPYPGTKLYDRCIENGYLPNKINFSRERRRGVLEMPLFSRRKIMNAYVWFEYRIYKAYKPRWLLLLRVLQYKILSNSFTNKIYKFFTSLKFIKVFLKRIIQS